VLKSQEDDFLWAIKKLSPYIPFDMSSLILKKNLFSKFFAEEV
jgi:hypothetical protein